ncbi:metallophosphoesterase family protein [Vaginella massiliensis]|uniref:metallophosphoesterase family protein n=1 Tax=Vaginella massiliensis TaxID=1816680 RepID=UPI000839A41B|nr:metallophosphoesterase family protein [Vaginella massiliensis]
MKKILLLSDTHSYLDDRILAHAQKADEIWHAGDIGNRQVLDRLQALKPVRAVYGNIDDATIRNECPENQIFELEGVKVLMTHIGGYPPKYLSRVKDLIKTHQPKLYICGHSHILKVMPDPKFHLLHMNPGAAGKHGFQQVRTMLRFELNAGRIENLEVIEFDQ